MTTAGRELNRTPRGGNVRANSNEASKQTTLLPNTSKRRSYSLTTAHGSRVSSARVPGLGGLTAERLGRRGHSVARRRGRLRQRSKSDVHLFGRAHGCCVERVWCECCGKLGAVRNASRNVWLKCAEKVAEVIVTPREHLFLYPATRPSLQRNARWFGISSLSGRQASAKRRRAFLPSDLCLT